MNINITLPFTPQHERAEVTRRIADWVEEQFPPGGKVTIAQSHPTFTTKDLKIIYFAVKEERPDFFGCLSDGSIGKMEAVGELHKEMRDTPISVELAYAVISFYLDTPSLREDR